MKLNKRQLKKIIRESIKRVIINENKNFDANELYNKILELTTKGSSRQGFKTLVGIIFFFKQFNNEKYKITSIYLEDELFDEEYNSDTEKVLNYVNKIDERLEVFYKQFMENLLHIDPRIVKYNIPSYSEDELTQMLYDKLEFIENLIEELQDACLGIVHAKNMKMLWTYLKKSYMITDNAIKKLGK